MYPVRKSTFFFILFIFNSEKIINCGGELLLGHFFGIHRCIIGILETNPRPLS